MIPYFQYTVYHLGPIPVYVWGTFVALGILIGACVAAWAAKQRGLKPDLMWDIAVWAILGSMIGGRLFQVMFYDPEYYFANPTEIIAIWKGGMSIIGGFIGAVVASVAYLYVKKLLHLIWDYADVGAFGVPIGLGIGRIGCFLIHDHPGTLTHFVLGVQYPDGVRHDLGLYESLLGFAIAILFAVLWKRKAPKGTYVVSFLAIYGTFRFFLDFLRATDGAIVDVRYGGLTPAQYSAILMVIGAGWLMHRYRLHSKKSRYNSSSDLRV